MKERVLWWTAASIKHPIWILFWGNLWFNSSTASSCCWLVIVYQRANVVYIRQVTRKNPRALLWLITNIKRQNIKCKRNFKSGSMQFLVTSLYTQVLDFTTYPMIFTGPDTQSYSIDNIYIISLVPRNQVAWRLCASKHPIVSLGSTNYSSNALASWIDLMGVDHMRSWFHENDWSHKNWFCGSWFRENWSCGTKSSPQTSEFLTYLLNLDGLQTRCTSSVPSYLLYFFFKQVKFAPDGICGVRKIWNLAYIQALASWSAVRIHLTQVIKLDVKS